MSADELERGLREKEKELNWVLDEEKYLRSEQKELLNSLEEGQALRIVKIKIYRSWDQIIRYER